MMNMEKTDRFILKAEKYEAAPGGASETLFEQIVRLNPNPMFTLDSMGRIRTWSKSAEALTGYSEDTARHREFGSLLLDATQAAVVREIVAEVFSGHVFSGVELHITRADRTKRVLVCRAFLLKDHRNHVSCCLISGTDVTDLRDAEENARQTGKRLAEMCRKSQQAEELYRTLLDSSPDPIVIYDLSGRVLFCNNAFSDFFGWTSDEIIGKTIPYVPESEREAVSEVIKNVVESGVPLGRLETTRLTKSGAIKEVSLSAARYNDHNAAPAGTIVILRDITERKQAEKLRLHTQRMNAVEEMAAGAAHNFNNLLQVIVGSCQCALAGIKSSDFAQVEAMIERICASAGLGGETVRRLQQFSRPQSDQVDEWSTFDLSETVDHALDVTRPWRNLRNEKNNVSIEIRTKLSNECYVKGKRSEIIEVIINLLKNSMEAQPLGGVITIETWKTDGIVRLKFSDDGLGIPREHLDRVFEPFWSTKGKLGAGIGLAGSYAIIKQHMGEIRVESREGHGAEFHIELPSAAHHHGNAPGPANRNGHDATILIIDDMPEITSMLQDGLSALGQNVLAALSGREGLSIIENVKVDCVVCDLGMMDMNGRQVSLAVKEFFETRKLRKPPFILLTGWASVTDDYSDLYNAGIDKVLAKPIDVVALLEEVRRALREQAGSETS